MKNHMQTNQRKNKSANEKKPRSPTTGAQDTLLQKTEEKGNLPEPLPIDQTPDQEPSSSDFPIVGLGASAGGLEAFSSFFSSLPTDTGTPRGPRKLAVTFEDIIEPKKKSKKGEAIEAEGRNKELEQELQYTRENLHSTVEELETANEELRSANEEYQSTNEELQSTNEELETSREELQSVNEELVTVNAEHQKKIEELSTINDDMQNLLNSTDVATMFLDQKLNIKRYTPAATNILNLIGSDIGRPLSHITSKLKANNLSESAK